MSLRLELFSFSQCEIPGKIPISLLSLLQQFVRLRDTQIKITVFSFQDCFTKGRNREGGMWLVGFISQTI